MMNKLLPLLPSTQGKHLLQYQLALVLQIGHHTADIGTHKSALDPPT